MLGKGYLFLGQGQLVVCFQTFCSGRINVYLSYKAQIT